MKTKLFHVFTLIVIFSLLFVNSSCSGGSGSNSPSSTPSNLIGTWSGSEGQYTGSVTFNSNQTMSCEIYGRLGQSQTYSGAFTYKNSTITCECYMIRLDRDGNLDSQGARTLTFQYRNSYIEGGPVTGMKFRK